MSQPSSRKDTSQPRRLPVMVLLLGLGGIAMLVAAALAGDWLERETASSNIDAPASSGATSHERQDERAGSQRNAPSSRNDRANRASEASADTDAQEASASDGSATVGRRLREQVIDDAAQALLDEALQRARLVVELVNHDADATEKDAAKEAWGEQRRAIRAWIDGDLARAQALLAMLGAMHDEPEVALRAAGLLPLVFVPGFEGHLIDVATDTSASTLTRQVALVGLRGRGRDAAQAADQVAAGATDTGLRAFATEELAVHLPDPQTLSLRNQMVATSTANLDHTDRDVRLAAVRALMIDNRPWPSATQQRLREIAANDPDHHIRSLATHVVRER